MPSRVQDESVSSDSKHLLPQKAVRVTTIMKRLRAPEQSDTGAASPAAAASPGDAAPAPLQADSTGTPAAATVLEGESAAVPEGPAGVETSQATADAAAEVCVPATEPEQATADAAAEVCVPATEPEQAIPAPEEADPSLRCNGEAPPPLQAAAEAGDEQS